MNVMTLKLTTLQSIHKQLVNNFERAFESPAFGPYVPNLDEFKPNTIAPTLP